MRVLESLFPRFLCPKCGWQMSEVGSEADFLPATASLILLLVSGTVLSPAWQFALG